MRSTIGGFNAFVAGFVVMLVITILALLGSGSSTLPFTPASGGAPAPTAAPPAASGTGAAPTAGGSAAAGGSTTVHAVEKDFAISLDTSTVKAGTVTFDIRNEGPSPHTLGVVKGNGASKAQGVTNQADIVKDSETISAGATAQLTVDLQPGTYQVVCTVPGHIQLGMILPLTVT